MDKDDFKKMQGDKFGQNCMPRIPADMGSLFNQTMFKVHPYTLVVTMSKSKLKKNYIEGGLNLSKMMYVTPMQAFTGRAITTLIFDDTIVPGLKDELSIADLEEWLRVIINPLLDANATVVTQDSLTRTKYWLEDWIAHLPSTVSIVSWDS